MHSPSEVRYRFGPLERRGLIGSLGPGQLLILAAAVLLAIPFRGVELGVIADRAAGTYAATIQARARSFVLLDPADKASRLAGWAGVVAGLAREGSPVSRVQWIERTVPDDRNSLTRYVRDAIDPSIGLDAAPLQSYLRDRKSTRLNSSHVRISYAVFCLK